MAQWMNLQLINRFINPTRLHACTYPVKIWRPCLAVPGFMAGLQFGGLSGRQNVGEA